MPPPGWYPDPCLSHGLRFWTGFVWTAATSPTSRRRDIDGASLGPIEAVASALRNITRLSGRASQSAYWWFAAFRLVLKGAVMITVSLVFAAIAPDADENLVTGLQILIMLPVSLAHLTVSGGLHDSNLPAGFLWLYALPLLGGIVLFFMMLRAPREPNRYPPPADREDDTAHVLGAMA